MLDNTHVSLEINTPENLHCDHIQSFFLALIRQIYNAHLFSSCDPVIWGIAEMLYSSFQGQDSVLITLAVSADSQSKHTHTHNLVESAALDQTRVRWKNV